MNIAIMQPYFIPYAGYFRLFAAADLFVALDCVQFPRRGWVHRNKLADQNGNLQWLTVPLKKANRDTTRICDLEYRDNASESFQDECRRFPSIDTATRKYPELASSLPNLTGNPTEYFINILKSINSILGFERPIIRSSSLSIPAELKAQDRILAIAKHEGATTYINAPGGKDLYNKTAFNESGIELKFLPQYSGSYSSIIDRLANESPVDISREIRNNLDLEDPE